MPRFFHVDHKNHVYVTFLMESYEGLATVSTVDTATGILRITPAPGREMELEGLLTALSQEIALCEVPDPTSESASQQ